MSGPGWLQVGVWTHVAASYDGSTISIYQNGDLVSTTAQSGDVSDGSFVLIGIWSNSFSGVIDEVRIWNVVRNQNRIRNNMGRILEGDENGLVGYWRFDEGSGQSVTDLSGDNNHGKLGYFLTPDSSDPIWVISDAPISYGE
jgi:hypothetical protein